MGFHDFKRAGDQRQAASRKPPVRVSGRVRYDEASVASILGRKHRSMTTGSLPATSEAAVPAAPPAPAAASGGFVRRLLLAGCFYFVCFVVLTGSLIGSFSRRFYADGGDGLQNVWNIWWVNHAVRLHQSIWHTNFLHYPTGTTLIGHTLNPFNGFLCVPLLSFLTLVQAHNFVVVFSFVMSGLGGLLLAYRFTRSYLPSLVAGFIFTFCNYHFAHAAGHLQLVSMEWLPFFVLSFYDLVHRPRLWRGVAAGLLLFLVILCDYYYFFFCVLAGAIVLLDLPLRRRSLRPLLDRQRLLSLAVFTLVVLATSGPIVWSLAQATRHETFMGGHDPRANSLDLLALFIPGGHWRFAQLTDWYWTKIGPADQPANPHEQSVFMGLSVFFLVVYAWWNRRQPLSADVKLLFGLLLFFLVMALGPDLRVFGHAYALPVMPYRLLETLFPLLKMSGCPVRMVVMVMLAASCLAAYALKRIAETPGDGKRVLLAALAILLLIEYLPSAMATTSPRVPGYVDVLKTLPGPGSVLDRAAPTISRCLYGQTVHEKPLPTVFGFIARMPISAVETDAAIVNLVKERNYRQLRSDYEIRYLVTPEPVPGDGARLIRDVDGAWIYELLPAR